MKNKYAKRSRISEAKIREIVRYVAADLTALQAAALSGLNRNTVNRLYRGVRERMLLACEAQHEVDESFFGARRVKGRRGRGAYGKTVVFGIFERQSIPRSSRTARSPPSRASSAAGSTRAPSSTPMVGAATTAWSTSAMATSASTMPATSSPKAPSISTASKAFGAWPRSGDPIQGPAETHLPPPSQGDRMAIQPSPRRQVQMPATVPTQEPAQLGMTPGNPSSTGPPPISVSGAPL